MSNEENGMPFCRSTSMQPMFNRDSDQKPSSFGEHSTNTNASYDSDGNCAAQYNNRDMSIVEPSSVMESNDAYGRVCAQLTGVTLSHDSGSEDIRGDTYFDQSMSDIGGDAYFDRDDEIGERETMIYLQQSAGVG